jgi:hypothetical protein
MKAKKKFNKFDLAVVIVILALIVGVFVKFVVLGNNTQEVTATTPVEYTLEIKAIRQYSVDTLEEGDVIYSATTKTAVGTISAIDVTDATTLVGKADGTAVWGDYEGRYDVTLTVTVDATEDNGRWRVDTYNLLSNKQASYYTKYWSFSATILQVTPITEN